MCSKLGEVPTAPRSSSHYFLLPVMRGVMPKKMISSLNIKRLSALVLVMAFFMPLSQCTHSSSLNQSQPPTTTVKYAYSHTNKLSFEMAASVASFFWPLMFISLTSIKKTLNTNLYFKSFEFIACLGSAYMLLLLNIFGKLLYGSYFAISALTVYGLLTLYEGIMVFRTKRHNNALKRDSAKNAAPLS